MGGNISVYGFGSQGVNLVKDPLELDDAEATQLQNAEILPDESKGGEGSLSKRGGLSALTSALAGSVLGIVAMPLQTTFTRTLLCGLGTAGSATMVKTTDGTTWTTITTPSRPARTFDKYTSLAGQSSLVNCPRRGVSYKTKVLYLGDDYTVDTTNPPLMAWDGTASYEIFRIPTGQNSNNTPPTVIADMLVANGKIYLVVTERNAGGSYHGGRVLCFDPRTAALTQVANAFGSNSGEVTDDNPTCLAWYQGKLWVGAHASNSGSADVGKVYWCYPDVDTTWTADVTNLNGKPNSLVEFKGNLYVGTSISDALGTVSKRTASSNAWTDVDSQNEANYTNLIVYNDTLFAVRYTNDVSDVLDVRSSTDGTTWVTSRDVYANDSSSTLVHPTGSIVFNSKLFIAFAPLTGTDIGTDGFILAYDGVSWTKVYTGNVSGPLVTLVERS